MTVKSILFSTNFHAKLNLFALITSNYYAESMKKDAIAIQILQLSEETLYFLCNNLPKSLTFAQELFIIKL